MDELARPFVRLWNYAERVGGFPGQILLCLAGVMLVIGLLTWLSHKK